ncbi:MAG: hypothetical protein SGJ27_27580 [Candidatus Melainabacteria bacterium]|nr:hypothetical protein [Candidatus Melainabacteria bacterium]
MDNADRAKTAQETTVEGNLLPEVLGENFYKDYYNLVDSVKNFNRIDQNGNGSLNQLELVDARDDSPNIKAIGSELNPDAADDFLVKHLGKDLYKNYVNFVEGERNFASVDINKNGLLSTKELKEFESRLPFAC